MKRENKLIIEEVTWRKNIIKLFLSFVKFGDERLK